MKARLSNSKEASPVKRNPADRLLLPTIAKKSFLNNIVNRQRLSVNADNASPELNLIGL